MKNKISSLLTVCFAAGIFFSVDVHAQTVGDALRLAMPGLGTSARALGMGNSYIGLSDDASAAYFNPAGLGLLNRMEFSGGLNYFKSNNSASFMGNTMDYSNTSTNLDQISFAFPFPTLRGSLVFGLSYNAVSDFTGGAKFDGYNGGSTSMIQNLLNTDVPYDLYLCNANNETPINGKLNQSGTVIQSGYVNNFTFSGAMEINKNLFVGLNVDIISGKYDYNREYYEEDLKGIYSGVLTEPADATSKDFKLFYLNSLLNWDIFGWDAKVGILYQYKDIARFGATVQFPKTFKIKEEFKADGRSEFGTNAVHYLDRDKYSDKVEYDITSPFTLAGGFAYNLKGFIFSAELSFIDYTQTKYDNPVVISDETLAGLNADIKDELRSVVNYNFGVEYTFAELGLRLRAGYFVQPSAYKNDPSDFDKKYVTGGLGFLLEDAISIDFAYAHGSWKDYGDNYGYNVSRLYEDISYNKFIATCTYRF